MQASLAMVPARVNWRGSLSTDRPAALARTLAQETGYILVLQVPKQGPDLYITIEFLTLPILPAFPFVSLSKLGVSHS